MRRAVIVAAVVACACAGAARADDKPAPIDATGAIDKLEVYRDDVGNFYVVPRRGAFAPADARQWVFYGDAHVLHRQRAVDLHDTDKERRFTMRAPRAKNGRTGSLVIVDGKATLACRGGDADGKRTLAPVAGDEAATLLRKAALLPTTPVREPHVLARDDDGVYYYIDRLPDDAGGKGFRMYVGLKGAMKEIALTNIVHDSAGELFASKIGSLKIGAGKDAPMSWIKKGVKTELTVVDPTIDHYLVYRELGIYGRLDAVCDDM
jgi:hypothetical protein